MNWMAKADYSRIAVGVEVKGSNNSESDLQKTFHEQYAQPPNFLNCY